MGSFIDERFKHKQGGLEMREFQSRALSPEELLRRAAKDAERQKALAAKFVAQGGAVPAGFVPAWERTAEEEGYRRGVEDALYAGVIAADVNPVYPAEARAYRMTQVELRGLMARAVRPMRSPRASRARRVSRAAAPAAGGSSGDRPRPRGTEPALAGLSPSRDWWSR